MDDSFKRFRKRLSSWLKRRRSNDQEPSSKHGKHNRKIPTPSSTTELMQPLDASGCTISLLPREDPSQACSRLTFAQAGPSPATLRSQSLTPGPSEQSNRMSREEAVQRMAILEQELRDTYIQLADAEAGMEQCAKEMNTLLSEITRSVDEMSRQQRELCHLEKKLERLINTAPPNEQVSIPKSKQV